MKPLVLTLAQFQATLNFTARPPALASTSSSSKAEEDRKKMPPPALDMRRGATSASSSSSSAPTKISSSNGTVKGPARVPSSSKGKAKAVPEDGDGDSDDIVYTGASVASGEFGAPESSCKELIKTVDPYQMWTERFAPSSMAGLPFQCQGTRRYTEASLAG